VEQLVDAGADVDQRDRAGKTPLYLAVELRHPQMVALLLGKGADPGKADQRGISPLAYARENGLTALVNLMQQHLGPGRAPVRRQPSPAARP
jgi:ankyrin repeat protein